MNKTCCLYLAAVNRLTYTVVRDPFSTCFPSANIVNILQWYYLRAQNSALCSRNKVYRPCWMPYTDFIIFWSSKSRTDITRSNLTASARFHPRQNRRTLGRQLYNVGYYFTALLRSIGWCFGNMTQRLLPTREDLSVLWKMNVNWWSCLRLNSLRIIVMQFNIARAETARSYLLSYGLLNDTNLNIDVKKT